MQAHSTVELKELSVLTYFGDMKNRVKVLDDHKIDKQVLTLARPSVWMNMQNEELHRLTPIANDAIAEAAAEYPDRFIPVAHLAGMHRTYSCRSRGIQSAALRALRIPLPPSRMWS